MSRKSLKLPKVMKNSQVLDLFSKTKNPRDKILLETIYYCGLRVSESLSLKKQDVDLKEKMIMVVSGKGNKDRLVPMPKPLLNDLSIWLTLQNLEDDERLFKITRMRVHQIIKEINPLIHAHTLRHSYGTQLYEKGVDLRSIAELMGHSEIETTKIYIHLSKTHKKKIIEGVFD